MLFLPTVHPHVISYLMPKGVEHVSVAFSMFEL